MIARNKTPERCKVTVTRVKPQQLAVAEPTPLACLSILSINLGLDRSSALTTRPAAGISRPHCNKTAKLPRICIRLDDGTITFNGRKTRIPLGLAGPITGKMLKKIASIYPGNLLFVRINGGMQRIRDKETIELIEGSEFRHQRPAPRFSSTSSLSGD